MSWDLCAQDFPPVDTIEEIPEDFEGRSLGSRTEVIDKIHAVLPDADCNGPSWAAYPRRLVDRIQLGKRC